MYLVNVLSEVTFTCKNDALPVVEGGIYRQYLRIPLSPPQPGYLIKQIEIADSTGAPTAIISALGGLTLDDLLSDTYAESVIPSLSNNDSYSDRYFETASADSPPADSNELYLQKQYTSAEETADPSSVGFKKISGATVGADDSVNVNGAYAAITWVRSDNSEQTLKTVINSDPSTAYLLTREFDNTAPVNSVDYSISDIGILRTNCKFVQQDDIYAVLDDPFNSTKEDGILYTVQETFVDLYTTQSFVPNSIQLKYIRKPRDINKSKGIGCELPEHTHHEIVEMAVKSILEGFESPRYNTQSGEVLESE